MPRFKPPALDEETAVGSEAQAVSADAIQGLIEARDGLVLPGALVPPSEAGLLSRFTHEDFVDEAVLGHGVSGEVRRVLHKPSGRRFARKRIPLVAAVNRAEALRELRAAAQHVPPQITRVYGAEIRTDLIQVSMDVVSELCDGSLKSLIDRSNAARAAAGHPPGHCVPEPVATAILYQMVAGFVFLHVERHMVHRDVKPGNVLFCADGRVKLADFGISGVGEMSAEGTVALKSEVGTAQYMSPERLMPALSPSGTYGRSADIWAVGLVAWELVIGTCPVPPGRQAPFALDSLIRGIIPPLAIPAEAGVTPAYAEFVAACLQCVPASRPTALGLASHRLFHGVTDDAACAAVAAYVAALPPMPAPAEDEAASVARAAANLADAIAGPIGEDDMS